MVQGFEWTFGWAEDEPRSGYPFLVDQWNVTKEGEIEIQMDISNQPDWCGTFRIGAFRELQHVAISDGQSLKLFHLGAEN